jgi:glutathione S-transferase
MNAQSLTITRFFNAPRERVFEAFTEPEVMQSWFGPESCTIPSVALDPRVGGRYRIEMHSREGNVYIVSGEYRDVRRPERLVFTWSWAQGPMAGTETLVTVLLREKDGGTELTLLHEGFPTAASRDDHNGGWASTFDCLSRSYAGSPKSPVAQPTVIGDPRSTYTRSACMSLIEKGIAYSFVHSGPHTEAVLAINPFGKIPAFRNAGFELYETSAIMRYVDEHFPGPPLCPDTPWERAKMEQWISAINAYFYDSMIRRYVLQYVFPRGGEGKPDRGIIEAALEDICRHLAVIERAYGGRDYLAGDRASLADLLLAPVLFCVPAMPEGAALFEPCPNIRRAQARMAERDSFKTTMPTLA